MYNDLLKYLFYEILTSSVRGYIQKTNIRCLTYKFTQKYRMQRRGFVSLPIKDVVVKSDLNLNRVSALGRHTVNDIRVGR